MMTIHRHTIAPTLELPAGATLLDIQVGQSGISAWFLVDPKAKTETRKFAIVATGAELPDAIADAMHLATVKGIIPTPKGPTITALHVFDVTHINAEIASVTLPGHTAGGNKPTDPADWWKKGDKES